MKLIFKLLIASQIILCSNALANNLQAEELKRNFATIYGWLSIIFETNREIDKKCQTSLSSPTLMNEADYFLRNKTGYSYIEWSTMIADAKSQKEYIKESVENVLSNIGGCDKERLKLINNISSNKVRQLILELRTLDESHSFKRLVRNDEEIILEFKKKVDNYQNLPADEVRELAKSLEIGRYSYAMNSQMVKVDADLKKASKLKSYLNSVNE